MLYSKGIKSDKSTIVSTSTRKFPDRLGAGMNTFLASTKLAAAAAVLERLQNVED